MNAKILIAEDDEHIREGLVDLLESEGFAVTEAADGDAAVARWTEGAYDLVILDIMMPAQSGYEVCREIRKTDEHTPVIMLTAKGEEIEKVVGLELGADDYITKPFGVHELLARIKAVLRRARRTSLEDASAPPEVFAFGQAEINRNSLRGTLRGETFDLTPRELQLLEFFQGRPGMVVSREKLMHRVWDLDYYGTTRTVDQHIAQLRKKIEPDPAHPAVITTVHGAGYRYEGNDEE